MGVTVRQKVKGRGKPWWVFICHNGKRKSMRIGDQKAAHKVASRIRQKLAKGKLNLADRGQPPTFADCAKTWLGYIEGMRRKSTFERYDEMLKNHILPVFGDKVLDRISRGDIRDFLVSKTGQGYSRSTICVLRDITSGVFNYAIDEEIIQVNPVSGITKRLELNRKKKP